MNQDCDYNLDWSTSREDGATITRGCVITLEVYRGECPYCGYMTDLLMNKRLADAYLEVHMEDEHRVELSEPA